MNENRRVYWIDALRFLACLCVFNSHFYNVFYRWSSTRLGLTQPLIWLLNYPLNLLVSGTFWVSVFFVLSGIFAGHTRVETFPELLIRIIRRYSQFLIPILVLDLIAWIMMKNSLFPTVEYAEFLNENLLKSFYQTDLSLLEVLKDALFLGSAIHKPFWMMDELFIGSCLVYVYDYLREKLPAWVTVPLLLLVIAGGMYYAEDTRLIALCLVGIVIAWMWENAVLEVLPVWFWALILILDLLILNGGRKAWIAMLLPVSQDVVSLVLSDALLAILLVLSISQLNGLQDVIGWRGLLGLYNLSFNVYLVHWPVICSLALYLFGWMTADYIKGIPRFFGLYGMILATVLLLALLYRVTFGRVEDWISGKLWQVIRFMR